MTLPLTKDMLAAAYDFLVTTPPFNRWNLPDSDDILFKVVRARDHQAYHQMSEGKHTVAVSCHTIGHTNSLMMAVGHELIHLYQAETGTDTSGVVHNAAFKKLAERVCKIHGWDYKLFSY